MTYSYSGGLHAEARLVIDDEPVNTGLIRMMLEAAGLGIRLVTCTDGAP